MLKAHEGTPVTLLVPDKPVGPLGPAQNEIYAKFTRQKVQADLQNLA